MNGRRGNALVRSAGGGREVYLQIPPGGSLVVAAAACTGARTLRELPGRRRGDAESPGRGHCASSRAARRCQPERSIDRLTSWTAFGEDAANFSGTASYTATFPRPPAAAAAWQIDLGQVHESARVRLNGRDVAALIGPPFRIVIDDASMSATNVLEVRVTNFSANRIRDLDRRGVAWKKFYNVNFPARLPQNRGPDGLFTAAGWDPLESGLLGPVTLTPLSRSGSS